MRVEDLIKKAAQIRLDALMSLFRAGSGHIGSAMSVVEILVALYYGEIPGRKVMYFDAKKPGWDGQDYLVLSKGHSVGSQYAILADLGFFDKSELDFLGQPNALLQARPSMKIPGIAVTTPATGHGLSQALGIALGLRMDKRLNKVFAVLGDGELQEGQVWEAAMAAAHYKLSNLIVMIDHNKVQSDGLIRSVMDIEPIQDKFEAFGWNVIQVRHGHDFDDLLNSLMRAFTSNRRPVCLWCHTTYGKGIEFVEGKVDYKDAPLSESEFMAIMPKLQELANR